jgi:hypothetical protein
VRHNLYNIPIWRNTSRHFFKGRAYYSSFLDETILKKVKKISVVHFEHFHRFFPNPKGNVDEILNSSLPGGRQALVPIAIGRGKNRKFQIVLWEFISK